MNDNFIGLLAYDGSCGICSKFINSWKKRLKKIKLSIIPAQSQIILNRIGEDTELMENIFILFNDNSKLIGADAYRYIFRRIWYTHPLYIFSIIPGFRNIFDLSYRKVAENRYRISKTCGLKPQ